MISLFIILIVIIGLTAALGYVLLSTMQSSELVAQAQRNAGRMEAMAGLLRGHSRPLIADGAIRLPVDAASLGPASSERTMLPMALVGDDHTPWGARYGYCPGTTAPDPRETSQFAGSVVDLTVKGGSTDYPAKVITVLGVSYAAGVTAPAVGSYDGAGEGRPVGVLGFIVSPSPNKQALPSCRDIAWRDGAFVIAGPDTDGDGEVDAAPSAPGSVTAITVGSSRLNYVGLDREPVLYAAANGSGSGSNPGSPMSLDGAIGFWNATQPANLVISLAPGTYLTSGIPFSSQASGRHLRLVNGAPGMGSVVIDAPGGAGAYLAFDIDAGIENISFSSSVGLKVVGSRVTVRGGQISQARLEGGELSLINSRVAHQNAATLPGEAISVTAGKLSLLSSSTIFLSDPDATSGAAAIRMTGGELVIGAPDLDVTIGADGLPWLLTDGARLTVMRSGTPTVSVNNGSAIAILASADVEANCIGQGEIASYQCVVECPTLTYPLAGSCTVLDASGSEISSTGSSLASSRRSGSGWGCLWADHVEDPRPLAAVGGAPAQQGFAVAPPARMKAAASCSASARRVISSTN